MTESQVVRDAFVAAHGTQPDVIASAPGRVNLIGEHVDYNGGRCLPMAIPQSTYSALRLRTDTNVTIASRQRADPWTSDVTRLGPGEATGWVAYAAGVVWAMRERGLEVPGFDLLVDGNVPLGAGLSSSAALECSVALAMDAALGGTENRHDLIQDCIRAERDVAGAPTGGMDQTVSMLGRAEHALLLDCATGETADVPWQPAAHGLTLLVIDTRAAHELVDGGYADRRAACEQAAAVLGVEHLAEVTDHEAALAELAELTDPVELGEDVPSPVANDRVDAAVEALGAGDFVALGRHFNASHTSLRDDFEVSCAELDVTVESCLAAGALGARMTGGGFGGSAIALLPDAQAAAAEAACERAFEERGWRAPRFLRVAAADGARVVSRAG